MKLIKAIKNKLKQGAKGKILVLGFILILVVGFFVPTNVVHAVWWDPSILPGPDDLAVGLLSIIGGGLLKLMSWITAISGWFLNYVLKYTIISMKNNLDAMTGINIAWKIIRDLMNIAFIFMLVYEGILLIIGKGSTAKVKTFITRIVLASLLINFSLFFTKVMIDASNIITVGFYNSIIGTPPPNSLLDYGLSDPIMKGLGLSNLYTAGPTDLSFGGGKDIGGILVMIIGSGLVLLITAFIFFAVSILFIIRYVTLLILLILSPVAYMGMGLPFMQKYATDWWNAFNSQLLFAPIYMIMTWVTLKLMESGGFITKLVGKNGDGSTFATLFNSSGAPAFDSMGLILNFVVIIGLLIASLIIAKNTSTKGSKHISDATGKLSAFAGGAVAGGAARISRNTVGRWGNTTANDEELKDRIAKGTATTRERLKFAAANKAATSSFDMRATKTFGAVAGAAGMKNDFGKVDSKKENFRAIRKEQEEAAAKKAEQYKPNEAVYAEAKEKDGKLKAEKAAAQERLNQNTEAGKRFVKEEAEAKDRHFKSDAWINSEAGKAETEALAAVENHKKAREVGEKAKKDWVYAERTKLENTTKRSDKENEEALDKLYQERVNAVANRYEKAGTLTRYASSVAKITLGTVGGGLIGGIPGAIAGGTYAATYITPKTKTDRQAIGRKIRGAPKGKKKLTAKELKDVYGVDTGEEETKTESPAPTLTPPTETPPATGGGETA